MVEAASEGQGFYVGSSTRRRDVAVREDGLLGAEVHQGEHLKLFLHFRGQSDERLLFVAVIFPGAVGEELKCFIVFSTCFNTFDL